MTTEPWSDDRNEDWAKRTWDVRTPDGQPVTSLDGLALVLGDTREGAAARLRRWPSRRRAPKRLVQEAQAVLSGDAPGGEPVRT